MSGKRGADGLSRREFGKVLGAAVLVSATGLGVPSAAAASGTPGLTALLPGRIFPIFSLVAPWQPGASPPSIRRRNSELDHLGRGFPPPRGRNPVPRYSEASPKCNEGGKARRTANLKVRPAAPAAPKAACG